MTVRWRSKDGRFVVEIGIPALAQMGSLLAQYIPNETGGILIGYHDESGAAVITGARRAPDDSVATPTTFQRGSAGVTEALAELWEREPRRFYLGEWHSHPEGPPTPSDEDVEQMRVIARDPAYRCPEAIMLIVNGHGWQTLHVVKADGDVVELSP